MKKIGLALTIALLLVLGATQTKADGVVISTKSGVVISTKEEQPTDPQPVDEPQNILDLLWDFFVSTATGVVISTQK